MTTRRNTGSGRAATLAVAAICLVPVGCQQPTVGARATAAAPSEGQRIVLEDARLDLATPPHVVATFSVTVDGAPLALAEAKALDPRFTLATLTSHPVDGLRAWKSQLLTGSQTAASLPPSGPGTDPALVVTSARQPGSETPASLTDLGGGRFQYVFATPLPTDFSPDETVRVGVWLRGAASPSLRTSSTLDFRPSGGPVEAREVVVDANCNGCHGNLVMHGTRTGVRLCLTCHTWQNADPDTIDPAALVTASTTAQTDPNPLELGRMVHRIHRGNQLPTLFQASSSVNPAPVLAVDPTFNPSAAPVDTAAILARVPFSAENNPTAILGRKYSIVGFQSSELIPGRVVQRTDNGQPAKTMATGIGFPRDLRDCGVCHAGAAQESEAQTAISRRTCSGCHPDAWFQQTPPTLDGTHFAHVGGPRADDSECANCHVQAPAGWKLYAPIAALHVPIEQGARYGNPQLRILGVTGLRAGSRAAITFRVLDRNGPVVPALAAPVPLVEPAGLTTTSYVARKLTSLSIRVAGPTAPDYGPTTTFLTSGTSAGNTDPLLLTTAAGTDDYVYTFTTTVPASARGTWTVGMEARRRLKYAHYDAASDTFQWPGTGETVTESPDNPVIYVDTATGTWPPDGPAPRRKVVAEQNCLRCHGRCELHGRQRHQVEYCLMCHNPTTTDYPNRKKTAAGFVDLDASFDGIEERSVHFKVMIHRIHTGARTGAASLEAIQPFLIASSFFDEVEFPGDLRNCTLCHTGKTYLVENVPSDAPATIANETATIRHAASTTPHSAGEPATPPIQAACLGCHATGATIAHVQSKTVGGVETCKQCHAQGPVAVEVAHGLAAATGTVASSFSGIVSGILVPRCASCHPAGGTQPPRLDAASAYGALVGVQSGQSSLLFVKPFDAEGSYLVHKLRGDATSVGGSGTLMPPEGALSPADLAAIEAWITNGAPND